jgi:hypothetical protein
MNKLIPPIYNFEEIIDDEKVTFLRVANCFGWWMLFEGDFYGDWIDGNKNDGLKASEILHKLLRNQAADTITELKKLSK